LIAEELNKAGGVWLVSGKRLPEAMEEVPGSPHARLASLSTYGDVLLLHLKPALAARNGSIRNVSDWCEGGAAPSAMSSSSSGHGC
jgi:hypothetical protein